MEVETREDLERAITPQTAMMIFTNSNSTKAGQGEEFAQLRKKHNVPTLNDAAADVPPVENLWKLPRWASIWSRSPAARGFAVRRAPVVARTQDLIAAARQGRRGSTVGRGMKVNKEEMLGMLGSLELYVEKDHEREGREFEKRAETIRSAAAAVPGVKAETFVPEVANHVPHVRIARTARRATSRPTPP